MKPKLGNKVYCLYDNGIFVDKVGYLGKDSFIIDDFNNCKEFDSLEWFFDDFNIQWFTSLSKAKTALIDKFKDRYAGKLKVVKINDDWYEIEPV